jgi:hypothetical protein
MQLDVIVKWIIEREMHFTLIRSVVMKKHLILSLFILSFIFLKVSYAQELFLVKNIFPDRLSDVDQIKTLKYQQVVNDVSAGSLDPKQIKKLKEYESYNFKPGNRIVAIFAFYPEKDSKLEFS